MSNEYQGRSSLSEILATFMNIHQNILNILTRISESTMTNADKIDFSLPSSDGTSQNFSVPSYSSLLRKMNHITDNVARLDNIKNRELGKPIFGQEAISEPEKITGLSNPTLFEYKPNWYLDNFINPMMYINLDVTKWVNPQSKYLISKRLILNLDTKDKQIYYQNQFEETESPLSYDTVISKLDAMSITYEVDEEQHTLPALVLQNSGAFTVLGMSKDIIESEYYSFVRKYNFSSIEYTDTVSDIRKLLQVGDKLITSTGETEYEVVAVDQATLEVSLGLKAGFEIVTFAADTLRISSSIGGKKEAHISVGPNETNIIFFKSTDPYYHTTSASWGDGITFRSNDLMINVGAGQSPINLKQFYEEQAQDYTVILDGVAKENTIGAVYGVQPTKPNLFVENFVIDRVNKHRKGGENEEKVKLLFQNLSALQNEHDELVKLIAATPVADRVPLNAHKTILEGQITATNTELTNITKAFGNGNYAVVPKYKVKGFWAIPEKVFHEKTGAQEIVQFDVSYRYLDLHKAPIGATKVEYEDSTGDTINAAFSEWTVITTTLRKKEYDELLDKMVWAKEDPANTDQININQIAISISHNEKVEIKVRAITEAGYPNNPIRSEWSNTVVIDFPDDEFVDDYDATLMYQNLQYYSLKAEMLECCDENRLAIKAMEDRMTVWDTTIRRMDELVQQHELILNPTADTPITVFTCATGPINPDDLTGNLTVIPATACIGTGVDISFMVDGDYEFTTFPTTDPGNYEFATSSVTLKDITTTTEINPDSVSLISPTQATANFVVDAAGTYFGIVEGNSDSLYSKTINTFASCEAVAPPIPTAGSTAPAFGCVTCAYDLLNATNEVYQTTDALVTATLSGATFGAVTADCIMNPYSATLTRIDVVSTPITHKSISYNSTIAEIIFDTTAAPAGVYLLHIFDINGCEMIAQPFVNVISSGVII